MLFLLYYVHTSQVIMVAKTTLLVHLLAFLLQYSSVLAFTVGSSSSRHHHHYYRHHAAISTSTAAKRTIRHYYRPILTLSATIADDGIQQQQLTLLSSSTDNNDEWKLKVLQKMSSLRQEAIDYAIQYDLGTYEATIYALIQALHLVQVPLGLSQQGKAQPILWRRNEILKVMPIIQDATDAADTTWSNFFTMNDLEKAVSDDFLDAARGSTDNRKGWKITDVSVPRGDSFEEARMTFSDVQAALEKGTVIMNAAGAHIPKLAGPCLACCHASMLPCALNLYVTSNNKRTSAPPHTDKQDVIVIQSTGQKYWKVYAPSDPLRKPMADVFARGKMDDDLPLYVLEKQSPLLLETILHPGDVLFVPAAFPHTTGSVINNNNSNKDNSSSSDKDSSCSNDASDSDTTSVHLTYGLDHHIWDLDYLSARRLALCRAHVTDAALGDQVNDALRYVGRCNELPQSVHQDLFSPLPLGLLAIRSDHDDSSVAAVTGLIQQATETLKDVSRRVDEHFQTNTFDLVDNSVWQETIERLVQQGVELLETHVDMYLAAIEEGRTRQAEDAMTAHLSSSERQRPVMSPERIQRLSLFRVKRYYDEINNSKQALQEWSRSGTPTNSATTASSFESSSDTVPAATATATIASLPVNWAFTMPVHVGDDVEADLGGAFFAAKVSRIGPGGDSYDVQFFDGDRESGLERSQIKLLKPPTTTTTAVGDDDVDTAKMTSKQLKRWRKQQQQGKLQK